MGRMKAIATVLVVTALGCALGGCSQQPSPTDVTTTFLNAVKTQNQEQCADVYSGNSMPMGDSTDLFSDISNGNSELKSDLTDSQKETMQKFLTKLLDYDYKVTGESVDGDSAKVDVEFSTYDVGDAITDALSSYMSKAFIYALAAEIDESKMTDMFMDGLEDEMNDMDEKDHNDSAAFTLTKTDNGWKIDNLDSDQLDAMFGGLYSCVESFSNK